MIHQNRQTQTELGTGLPFLLKKERQQRFREITTTETNGYWEIPQNRLPTFQVWNDFEATKFSIIPILGANDGTPIEIPLAELQKRCTVPPLEKYIYYTTDAERGFSLDCGFYYIEIEFDSGARPSLYSEVFFVAGECAIGFGLDYIVIQINVDLSADIDFTITGKNITAYATSINGAGSIITKDFSATLPVGDNTVAVEVETAYCGTYIQNYIFRNTAGVITVLKSY